MAQIKLTPLHKEMGATQHVKHMAGAVPRTNFQLSGIAVVRLGNGVQYDRESNCQQLAKTRGPMARRDATSVSSTSFSNAHAPLAAEQSAWRWAQRFVRMVTATLFQ